MGRAERGDSDRPARGEQWASALRPASMPKGQNRMSPAWHTGAVHVVGRRACAEGWLSQKGTGTRGAALRCGALAPRVPRCAGEGERADCTYEGGLGSEGQT